MLCSVLGAFERKMANEMHHCAGDYDSENCFSTEFQRGKLIEFQTIPRSWKTEQYYGDALVNERLVDKRFELSPNGVSRRR